jgi:hypothetical protein
MKEITMPEEAAASTAITADDWGTAMAEQASVESTPAETAKPHVFEQFGSAGGATTHDPGHSRATFR